MEESFKELPFLDILIKNENDQIITDINHPINCIKSIRYILIRRICAKIVKKKNLRKTRLKELPTTRHQRGYPTALINKGFN